jgi:hypothetical protein
MWTQNKNLRSLLTISIFVSKTVGDHNWTFFKHWMSMPKNIAISQTLLKKYKLIFLPNIKHSVSSPREIQNKKVYIRQCRRYEVQVKGGRGVLVCLLSSLSRVHRRPCLCFLLILLLGTFSNGLFPFLFPDWSIFLLSTSHLRQVVPF